MIKLKSKVVYRSGDGYYRGVVTKIKKGKALVFFRSRGLSRWINISNLGKVSQA